ncbi:MAG: TIM barrel protein, partial [Pseudomonadota bacterium]|nr:TIM barrel protein [Pseudomonadota bacterium]
MTLAISTTSIPGSLADKVAAIAKAGFTGLELHEPDFTGFHGSAQDLHTMVEGYGLKTNLLKPFNDLEGWEGEARRRSFDRLERKFDLMQSLGTELLLVGASSAETCDDAQLQADLAEAAERAAARGVASRRPAHSRHGAPAHPHAPILGAPALATPWHTRTPTPSAT